MNQETHDIGNVYLNDECGMIWLARADFIGHDKVVFSRETLSKAVLTTGAKIYYQNKIIGKLNSIKYNRQDGFLIGFFSLTNKKVLPGDEFLVAQLNYEHNGIQCIRCENFFKVGSESCDCIENSPAIKISQLNITNVHFYDVMHEDINKLDARRVLLLKYFGGIIASINLNKEEF
jgi:hypothetical protein